MLCCALVAGGCAGRSVNVEQLADADAVVADSDDVSAADALYDVGLDAGEDLGSRDTQHDVGPLDAGLDAPLGLDELTHYLAATDWAPESGGTWAVGLCTGVRVPRADPEFVSQSFELTRDGICACVPGFCIEVPANSVADSVRVQIGAFTDVPDRETSEGPAFFLTISRNAPDYFVPWGELSPAAPWRVAVAAFPDELLAGRSGSASLTLRYAFYQREIHGLANPVQVGGADASGTFAAELIPVPVGPNTVGTPEVPRFQLLASANYCGDGILGPHEQCDDLWNPDREYACAACRLKPGWSCDAESETCAGVCDDVECEDPGPCKIAGCDSRIGRCVVYPDRLSEGARCTTDTYDGWCEAGECVPEPRECVECAVDGAPGRWHRGACRRTEQQWTWEPDPSFPVGRYGFEDGVWHTAAVHGGITAGYVSDGNPNFALDEGWFEAQYRTVRFIDLFTDPPSVAELNDYSISRWRVPQSDPEGTWRTARVPVTPSESYDGRGIDANVTAYAAEPDAGQFDIRRFRISELGLGVCSVGVEDPESESGWSTCFPRVGMAWCGEACTNLLTNPYHCGTCGRECGERQICNGGECVCAPAYEQYAPEHCEGCEPGYWGFDCDQPCPGLTETGEACSGRGTCSDGPLGTGLCTGCERGYHGLACEFSCADGVRNGQEQSIDCGGPCASCATF